MSGITFWEASLEEDIRAVEKVLDAVKLTQTGHVLSIVWQMERKIATALETKRLYKKALETLKQNEQQQHAYRKYKCRLDEMDQQLLSHQMNWDVLSRLQQDPRQYSTWTELSRQARLAREFLQNPYSNEMSTQGSLTGTSVSTWCSSLE